MTAAMAIRSILKVPVKCMRLVCTGRMTTVMTIRSILKVSVKCRRLVCTGRMITATAIVIDFSVYRSNVYSPHRRRAADPTQWVELAGEACKCR